MAVGVWARSASAVGFGVLAACASMAAGVLWFTPGVAPGFLQVAAGANPASPLDLSRVTSDRLLEVAGSGTNLPLTRALAAAFSNPTRRVVVHASVGSSGGARAALDGVVDLALMSRPPRDRERSAGLVAWPYAHSPVVLAASPDVLDDSIHIDDLCAVLRGEPRRWGDGRAIVALLREAGDSGHRAVSASSPRIGDAIDRGLAGGRWRILHTDAQMLEAMSGSPAALGFVDATDVRVRRPELRELAVVGGEALGNPMRTLWLAAAGERGPLAAEFLAFARSEAGREVIERAGYAPGAAP